jgi:L-lactate dehydrogenase complex protein LldG
MSALLESTPLIESFITRATAVSAEVERIATRAEAIERLIALLRQEGVSDEPQSYAVCARCAAITPADQAHLAAEVPGLHFDVTRELASEAKVGISQLEWALANTGTLVQAADAPDTRLVSMLPPLHIALVSTRALLPDLPAVLTRVDPRRTGYLAFITGPSRTADIERVLTIGVHGPGRLIILMVDELPLVGEEVA